MSLIAVVIAVLLLVISLWKLLGGSKHAIDNLPGPPTVPFFGNALSFATSRVELLKTFRTFSFKYWPIYRTWFVNIPVIHPHSPADIEAILTSSQHITKSHEYNFISEWLGDGLLTSRGAKWHKRRKMLTPTFHFKILEEFVPVFHSNIKILISKLRKQVNKKEGVDIVPIVTHCALDIICETAMGIKVNAQGDKDSEYVSAMYEMNEILVHRAFRPWLFPGFLFRLFPSGRRHDKVLRILHNVTNKVIQDRKAERKMTNANKEHNEDDDIGTKKKTAFLDLLLEVSEKDSSLTDKDIREEVDTFMFEGHDTTAMAMSWCLFFIGNNPHVQDKIVAELSEIFSGSDRPPSMTDLSNMKYLERVIKESLRLRPSVYAIGRKLDTTLKLGDNVFPANTRINLHIHCIHRNPEIFPDPEKFDPDRFLPENCVGRHPYAYIPFSAGPRNCIGQKFAMLEMKSLLSTVVRNFRLTTLNPEFYYQGVIDLILRPLNGVQMTLTPRDLP